MTINIGDFVRFTTARGEAVIGRVTHKIATHTPAKLLVTWPTELRDSESDYFDEDKLEVVAVVAPVKAKQGHAANTKQ
jgi:hypothetical protein